MEVVTKLLVLERDVWTEHARTHAARVAEWTRDRSERASRGRSHPVEDFLFTYYPTRPGRLRRWHPGLGVGLADAAPGLLGPAYRTVTADGRDVLTVDPGVFTRRRAGLAWVEALVRRTAQRPARLTCFGLHEWAMVYGQRPDEIRHETWPLRLEPDRIREVVDEQGLRCTHFDAVRFFTPEAVPHNEFAPTRATQPDLDQPGCLHATMDLYKWADKYVELVGSDLVSDAFAVALEARRLDMEAAPYDLAALGYSPIRVETADGRAEYVRRQRVIATAGERLRARLAPALAAALAAVDAADAAHAYDPPAALDAVHVGDAAGDAEAG